MMIRRLILATALVAATATITAPRDAHALFCMTPYPETTVGNAARHSSTVSVINARIQVMENVISAELTEMETLFVNEYTMMVELLNRLVSNQQSQSAQNQSAIQTHSQQTRAALTGLNEEQVRREKKQMMQEATIAATPSATGCQVASASVALDAAARGTAAALDGVRGGSGSGSIGRAQGGGRIAAAPSAPRFSEEQRLEGIAPDADMAVSYAEFLEFFCNERFAERGVCRERSVDGAEMADRDIDPWESLFGRSTLNEENRAPGDPEGRSYDRLAAESVIRNLIQPIPPEAFPVEAVQNDVENRRLYVRQRANQARIGLANLTLEAELARRDPSVDGAWAKDMLAKFEIDEADIPDEVSEHEMYEILMSQRFKDPDYWLRITGAEGSVTMEEVAQLLALRLMMGFDILKNQQRLAAMEATDLGMRLEGQQLRPNLEGIRSQLDGPAITGGHGAGALALFDSAPARAALHAAARARKPATPDQTGHAADRQALKDDLAFLNEQ